MNLKYVNLSDYPINQPHSEEYKSLVVEWRRKLVDTGLVNLDEFLTDVGVEQYRSEIYERRKDAYHSMHGAQAYFDNYPRELPTDVLGSNTFCLGHHNLQDTAMDQFFRWEPVRHFIAALTDNTEVFLHEDPTNALVVQLYEPGCWTGWHFDRAKFTTIVNLGEPESGGVFECASDIRTEDDPSYANVGKVLWEQSDRVCSHTMKAGSLTLMLGRYSLHRVTKITGEADRISLVLKYETQPGVSISDTDRKLIYGPSVPDGPENTLRIANN